MCFVSEKIGTLNVMRTAAVEFLKQSRLHHSLIFSDPEPVTSPFVVVVVAVLN